MEIAKAQEDMRSAYYGGAAGVLVSATAWLIAAMVALHSTQLASIVTLYVGGMFIFPLAIVVSKLLGRPGILSKGNTLGMLGLESTGILIFCYPLAYVASLVHVEWFYPAMLVLIGVRYLLFTTLYGHKVYWIFGMVLILAGYTLAISRLPFHVGAFVGSALEYVFGMFIFVMHRKRFGSGGENV